MTSNKETVLDANFLRKTWTHFNSIFNSVSDGIEATSISGNGKFYKWKIIIVPKPISKTINYLPEGVFSVKLIPNNYVRMVAGFSDLPAITDVDKIIDQRKQAYLQYKTKASGDWGDFLSAITDNMNNTRVYSTLDKRISHVVSRAWSKDADYLPYFGWDSFFNGLLAATEDPDQAWESLRAVFTYQTPEGMIANTSHWLNSRSGFISIEHSQPPVGALCVWKMYEITGDKERMAEFYPKLVKWHNWWHTTSDQNNNYLLEWYSSTGIFQQARFATGWDDTPHFLGADMKGTVMGADAVDLSALWAMDAEYLSKIATALGKSDQANNFKKEQEKMNAQINKILWNEELGVYCTRLWDSIDNNKPGKFLTRITPANFYPMISGAPSKEQAQKLLKVLYDPNLFWGKWIIPTLAYNDPDYPKQNYWKGKVWAPTNYLMWQGMRKYCDAEHLAYFTRQSVDLFMTNWNTSRTCGENFNSITGLASSDNFYTWGALLPRIGLEAVMLVDENLKPIPNKGVAITENIQMQNVLVGGKKYSISLIKGQFSTSEVKNYKQK